MKKEKIKRIAKTFKCKLCSKAGCDDANFHKIEMIKFALKIAGAEE